MSHNFVLAPIRARAKLILNKNPIPEIGRPRIILTIDLDDVLLHLDDIQYGIFVNFTKGLSRFQRSLQYRKLRPSVLKTAREKWNFACKNSNHLVVFF